MELSTMETSYVASSTAEASSSGITSRTTTGISSKTKFRAVARTTGPRTAATLGSGRRTRCTGYGVFTWEECRKYKGSYVDGKKEGNGHLILPDGRVYEGLWKDGRYTENCGVLPSMSEVSLA